MKRILVSSAGLLNGTHAYKYNTNIRYRICYYCKYILTTVIILILLILLYTVNVMIPEQTFPPLYTYLNRSSNQYADTIHFNDISSTLHNHIHIPPDIWLHEYALRYVNRHRNVLTYKPTVDCVNGRYLIVDNIVHTDGLGNMLIHYNTLLHMAMELNLTAVHSNAILKTSHQDDETGVSRELWLRTLDWEIDPPALHQCPHNSPVILNRLYLNDTYKRAFKNLTQSNRNYTAFVRSLSNHTDGRGFTVTIRDIARRNATGSMLTKTQIIHELRHHALLGAVVPTPPSTSINVAIHLRRGDLIRQYDQIQQQAWTEYGFTNRWLTVDTVSKLCDMVLQSIDLNIFTVNVHIYTQFPLNMSIGLNYLQSIENTVQMYSNTTYTVIVNGASTVAFTGMRDADILIMSPSSYSHAVGIFNSESIKLGTDWYNDLDGMRGYVYMDVTNYYTPNELLHPYERKQVMCADCLNQTVTIRNYTIYQQQLHRLITRKQTSQSVDSFLNNYSDTYPNAFVC